MSWGNTWEPAKLVGESTKGETRSFVVTASKQEYRRNRRDILRTSEEITTSPETTSTMDMEHMEEPNGNEEINNNSQDETKETLLNSPVVVSRVSGRIIKNVLDTATKMF